MPTLRILLGDNDGSVASTDILQGDDGYTLRLDGWEPQIAQDKGDGFEDVLETITFKVEGSSREDLSNKITDDIDKKIHYVKSRINDPVAPNLAYLIWTWSLGDTIAGPVVVNERRALIKKLSYKLNHSPYFPPMSSQNTALNLALAIERAPFWEAKDTAQANAVGILTSGQSLEATGVLRHGSMPGRIKELRVSGTTLLEFWMGFRTDKHGAREYFQPVWTFDTVSTANGATTSSSNSDDGAVSTVVWASADSSLLERMTITMNQAGLLPRATHRGTFTVLLRARSTGTETFNVRMSDGFSYGGHWNTHSRVKVSGTSFLFYPLGTVTIPPLGVRDSSHINRALIDYALRIEAEVNTAGTGNLEMTRFVLIPQDEGYMHIKGVNTGSLSYTYVANEVDGRWIAYTYWHTIDRIETPEKFDIVDFFVPNDDFNIVFAGHGASQSLTSTSTAQATYYPRYIGVGESRG